jgi:hypothetical protein
VHALHRDRIGVLEEAPHRAHAVGRIRIPHDAAALRHDQERRRRGCEPLATARDERGIGPPPARVVAADRRRRHVLPACDQGRRLRLDVHRHEETRVRHGARTHRRGWRGEVGMMQTAEPRHGRRHGDVGGSIGPRRSRRGVGEGVAFVVGPLEPPGRRLDAGGRNVTATRHAVPERQQVRQQLGMRRRGVQIAGVDEPGARVQQLHVRPHALGLHRDGDVAPARRRPGARPPGEVGAAAPVTRPAGVEERDRIGRPAGARRRERREGRRHAAVGQVLDRHEHEPGVVEVEVRERIAHAPFLADPTPATNAATPHRRRPCPTARSPDRSSARSSSRRDSRRRPARRSRGCSPASC